MEQLNNAGVGSRGAVSVSQVLEIVTRSVEEALQQRQKQEALQEAMRALDVKVEEIFNMLPRRMRILSARMEKKVAKLAERMEERVVSLEEQMEEKLTMLVQRMQEREDAMVERMRTLEEQMERVATLAESQTRMEGRVMALETTNYASGEGSRGQETAVKKLEGRVQLLEDSVQKAQERIFTHVDSLLKQLEGNCHPQPFGIPLILSDSPPTNSRVPNESWETPSASTSSPQPCALPSESSAARTSSASPSSLTSSPAVPSSQHSAVANGIALGEELFEAVKEGRVTDVERLLNEGANVNCRDDKRWTPLMWAAGNVHADVVSLLLERGADVNAKDEDGATSLHWASANDYSGRCAEILIGGGAQVNYRNRWGETALHDAAFNDNLIAVLLLNSAGSSNTVKDNNGRVPSDLTRDPVIRGFLRS